MTVLVELLLLSTTNPDAARWLATVADQGPEVADAAQQVLRRHDASDARYDVLSQPSLLVRPDEPAHLEAGRRIPVPMGSELGEDGQPVQRFTRVFDGIVADVEASSESVRVDLEVDRYDHDTAETAHVSWTGAFAPNGAWVVQQPSSDLVLVSRARLASADGAPTPGADGAALLADFDLDSRRGRRQALQRVLPARPAPPEGPAAPPR